MHRLSQEMIESTEYGHLHLGFLFRPVLSVDQYGLNVRGRHYEWSEIDSVSHTASGMLFAVGYPLGKPTMTIRFRDGSGVSIDSRSFCKRGERPRVGFFSGRSQTIDELLGVLERHLGKKLWT